MHTMSTRHLLFRREDVWLHSRDLQWWFGYVKLRRYLFTWLRGYGIQDGWNYIRVVNNKIFSSLLIKQFDNFN